MWRIEFAADVGHDFALIFDHLLAAYVDFGDPGDVALDRAAVRIRAIQADAEKLAELPFQGTLLHDIVPDVRFVRRNNAVFWFRPDAETEVVRILAVFFGAQDHIRHMMVRILDRKAP
ncbi:type II toxin-antitoxin system RelE/ParE family toxin [Cognatiyoonia sp. IB215446]|uniref:type II toxin-antitoxin system RelE/ParE family toxin n=1 Tax=Cognatiyoonia sp. IB215446 TaxID=3097355 RepID=UPI002A0DEEF7|nr:type II toxin-antitoxin system RelE/ParE family toxin [Cognatiyoonia sp. IB215446]MDX8350404.1 type II toxin-antitoxin system RelE/ParE family toxin [Cognatiyoonia sp. IB215446]